MNLIQLLRDQRQELEEGVSGKKIIKREAEEYYTNLLDSKLIKVISGVRRCGKSVFAYMLLKDRNFAYMNFDDERLSSFDTNQILSSFYEIYGKEFKYIFLDEVQNLDNWELFVNRLKRAGFNLVITGSNAKMLSKELATHLTGRHTTIELLPFSFREYQRVIDFQEDIRTTRGMALLRRELKNYVNLGGFPEILVEEENPRIYLRGLYGDIIEKDIINRHGVSYKKTFREIAMTLLSNPGRGITYNRIKNQFSLGSEHTAKDYVSYLEEAYLVFLLSRFSFKPVEVEKSEKKVYVIDVGMVNSISTKSSPDYGHIYENLVAIELLRRKSFAGGGEFYYWKNPQHEEVDFVVKKGVAVGQLVQVCWSLDDEKTKEREIRALLKASKELKCLNLVVITNDYEAEEKAEERGTKRTVKFIPFWKWLLNTDFS